MSKPKKKKKPKTRNVVAYNMIRSKRKGGAMPDEKKQENKTRARKPVDVDGEGE